ncbi:fimbrial protein [Burkholderia glumae]|uniref:fimbrial protein n=1 Tax=Burkholderia glumae TaxID=337 RepID=UPI003B9D7C76
MNFDRGLWGPENKIVCVELNRSGLLSNEELRADTLYYRQVLSKRDWHGYGIWGRWLVARMRRHPALAACLCRPVRWLASDSAHQLGLSSRPHLGGMLVRRLCFLPACRLVGALAAPDRRRGRLSSIAWPASLSTRHLLMNTYSLHPVAGALLALAVSTSAHAFDGTVNFNGNVVDAPCTISTDGKNLQVSMQDISTGAVLDGSAPKTPFSIKLNNCSTAIKKTVQVTFSGTKAGDGMLALTSESGAAKNVAIQLYQDGKALKLDTTSASVKLKTGDNDIPFAAQYTSNGGTPVAGKANAIAQFTLSYP